MTAIFFPSLITVPSVNVPGPRAPCVAAPVISRLSKPILLCFPGEDVPREEKPAESIRAGTDSGVDQVEEPACCIDTITSLPLVCSTRTLMGASATNGIVVSVTVAELLSLYFQLPVPASTKRRIVKMSLVSPIA